MFAIELARRLDSVTADVTGTTGAYFDDCVEPRPSVAARDRDLGRRLWELGVDPTAPSAVPGSE